MQLEEDRFISKVIYNPQTTCWDWTGAKYRDGYGHFRRKIDNVWVMYKAHRFSYEYFNNTQLNDVCVLHKCDNPSCVNPDHLFLGTNKDNHWDMRSKNRWKLIRNPKHRLLNMDIAKQIRAFSKDNPELSQAKLAVIFNTSSQQISRILINKIWQEVL